VSNFGACGDCEMILQSEQGRSIRRLKWIFGTTYAVQGSSAFTDIPTLYFVKFALGMGDAGGQLFQSLKSLGWLIKPVWGWISDRVPLMGYHRKSWFILMAVLGVIFWLLNALLALLGVRTPVIFLIGFNLAFSTYAFVDVVADALMVEHGRRLKRVGSFVNFSMDDAVGSERSRGGVKRLATDKNISRRACILGNILVDGDPTFVYRSRRLRQHRGTADGPFETSDR
jgi:BT1 family protein